MLVDRQVILSIILIALTTALTRFLPFGVFSNQKKVPKFLVFLGKHLPRASIALLLVYALKEVKLFELPYGLPELISLTAIGLIHIKWRKAYLSIGIGTILYMYLVQIVF